MFTFFSFECESSIIGSYNWISWISISMDINPYQWISDHIVDIVKAQISARGDSKTLFKTINEVSGNCK